MITKLQNIEDFGGRGSNYREKTYNSERHGRHMAHILTEDSMMICSEWWEKNHQPRIQGIIIQELMQNKDIFN